MAVSEAQIERALEALEQGEIVSYPTETVYGLGVDASRPEAVARLLECKGREGGSGISVLVSDVQMAARVAGGPLPEGASSLAERFWPGPLTLVVPAPAAFDERLTGPAGGIGLRCSSDESALALVTRLGRPVTSTSANPSGREPALTSEQARAYFGDKVAVYIDDGRRSGGAVSSVVEFLRGSAILRRAGAIALEDIETVTGPVIEEE